MESMFNPEVINSVEALTPPVEEAPEASVKKERKKPVAKAAKAQVQAPEPKEEPKPLPPKTQLVAEAIKALGFTRETVKAPGVNSRLVDWILQQPGVGSSNREYLEKNFSITKDGALAKLGWKEGQTSFSQKTSTTTFPSEPTLTDLLKVKEFCSETKGGLEELEDMVRQVVACAEEVGGLDRLQQCLKALRGLSE